MNIFVQFTDGDQLAVRSVFGERQADEEVWPNQGEVSSDDPRYLAYLAPPSEPLPDLAELIAAERYKREGVGITVDGSIIDTTRDGQALIAGAAVSAMLDPAYACNWKTAGGFVELNAVQLVAIATAVRAHVQACFDRELVLLRAIEAGEYRDEMLVEGWPDSPPLPEPVELQ